MVSPTTWEAHHNDLNFGINSYIPQSTILQNGALIHYEVCEIGPLDFHIHVLTELVEVSANESMCMGTLLYNFKWCFPSWGPDFVMPAPHAPVPSSSRSSTGTVLIGNRITFFRNLRSAWKRELYFSGWYHNILLFFISLIANWH